MSTRDIVRPTEDMATRAINQWITGSRIIEPKNQNVSIEPNTQYPEPTNNMWSPFVHEAYLRWLSKRR